MRKSIAPAAAAFSLLLCALPAQAQLAHSWVASTGDDSHACDRAAPCRTLSGAFNKTNAGGEILCADSVDFGGILVIQKSITLNCEGVVGSSVTMTGSVGVFDIETAASDRVILRGLDLDHGGANYSGHVITFESAGTLILDRVKISGTAMTYAMSPASGLNFAPSGVGKLIVTDSLFAGNGGSQGAGIRVKPSSGGTAQVSLERVTVASNLFGIAFDGSSSTGGINATIKDSQITTNTNDGVIATTSAGGAPIGVTVINSQITNNGYGVRSIGSNVTVRLDDSKVIGNGTGLSGGGALLSLGNNVVEANGSNGAFTGAFAFK